MDAAAHDKVAHHLAGHRVLGRFVDPDLAHPRARLKEEVMEQIELEVARVEDVVARPRLAARAAGYGTEAEVCEVVGIAGHAGKVQGWYGLVAACLGLVQ